MMWEKTEADLLIAVEGVQVLQRSGHQVRRGVPVDEGQRFPCLQVAVGLWTIFIIAVAAALRPWSPGLLLGDAPLDGGQRLGDEGAEAVGSGRYKQLCHLVILLLQRAAGGSAGAGSCSETRAQVKGRGQASPIEADLWTSSMASGVQGCWFNYLKLKSIHAMIIYWSWVSWH